MKVQAMTDLVIKFLPAKPKRWRGTAVVLGAALSVVVPTAVQAQSIGTGPASAINHANSRQNPNREKPELPAPDAIPGAKAREPAAPATRMATDMPPTDALFDAINRGDIASARDALNRGADLNGMNILGMTPMELSVDLGRNDISFLLLSMRGEDSGRGSRAVGRDVTAAGKMAQATKPATSARTSGAGAKLAGVKVGGAKPVGAQSVGAQSVAGRPVATPKLFADDGGTPLPSAGFLGFGSRSAT
ncbi:MAG TPA: hypothetical protein VGC82_17015, partial [Rhodopila sp.]